MAPLSNDRLALLRAVLAEKGVGVARAESIPHQAGRRVAPLSFAQERLFFLELLEPDSALHNDTLAFWLEGALDVARLRHAFATVQARHAILRSAFVLGPEGPEQRVEAEPNLPFEATDLRAADAPRARARELARSQARTPFVLEHPPLWRATLARLGEREWCLIVTLHHIVSDGASVGLLVGELEQLYAGRTLAPLAVQFGDYAAWERTRERDHAADLEHWMRVLSGLPTLALARPGGTQGGGAQVPVELEAELVARLERLAHAQGCTTHHLLLAAWFTLLSAASGAEDLATGIASSLRKRRELEPLIGFFVQSLALRMDLGGERTFASLARAVRAAAFEALEHSEVPFDRVVRALGRGPGQGPPLLTTFFSHMRDAIRAPQLDGVRGTWEFVDAGVARFELALVLHESAQGVCGFLEHDLGRFEPARAAELARDYVRLLAAVLEDPERSLSELRAVCAPGSRDRTRRRPTSLPAHLRRPARGTP